MPDLIDKFFREDLTEAEEVALEELLETSEEGAEKLAAIAEKNYYRFGFPTPRLPGGGEPPAGLYRGTKPWTLFSILIGVLMASFLYCKSRGIVTTKFPYFCGKLSRDSSNQNGFLLSKNTPSTPRSDSSKSHLPVKRNINEGDGNTLSKDTALNRENEKTEEKPAAFKPENRRPFESSLNVRVQPIVTPINMDAAPSRKFSGISVEIKQSEPGFVAVRVLDMSGLEVTPLYSGNLEPGHWAFVWDGQLGKGKQAKPGYYQVEVKSGSFAGSKNILIK